MKKFFLFLIAFPLWAQTPNPPVLVTFEGGVAGTSPTAAQMNAGLLGCPGSGTFNSGSGSAHLTVVTATGSPSFPAATQICGTPQLGNGTKVLQWDTGNSAASFAYTFRTGSKTQASFGVYFCADFDRATVGGQYSNNSIITNAGANQQNILLGPNPSPGGVSLEVNGGFSTGTVYQYHGGNCLTDPTAWIWITLVYNTAANGMQMKAYDYQIKTLLGSWSGTGLTNVLNPGLAQFGITGGEAQPLGHHLYWKNEMIDDQTAVFPLLPNTAPWGNIISSPRAVDWSGAGVIGGIPSATWTQCGTTIAPYTGTPATINAAITACGANQYVLLDTGTFVLSQGIDFGNKSNVVLRGQGANLTFLQFPNDTACTEGGGFICNRSSDGTFPPPSTVYNWTAGYSQGTTQVTLSSVTGIVANQTILVLTQCPDGKSGNPCTGTSVDTGAYFDCGDKYATTSGCSFNGPDSGNGWVDHFQQEMILVTAVNGNVVTLQRPLHHANWNAARTPVAWFWQPVKNFGVENLAISATGASYGSAGSAIKFSRALNAWVKGVKVAPQPFFSVYCVMCVHSTWQDNYISGTVQGVLTAQVPHAFNMTMATDILTQNNIAQGIETPFHEEGPSEGSVIGYNFAVFDFSNSDNMGPTSRPHANGNNFLLYEGNVFPLLYLDESHGTQPMNTMFRNFATGWESCANTNCAGPGVKDFQTNAIGVDAYNRYGNYIGNVLGTPTFHNTYKGSGFGSNKVVLLLGSGNPATTPAVPADTTVGPTSLLWGNYDVVTAAVRFCGNSSDTGWVATCASTSEVPTTDPNFPNTVPSQGDTVAGQSAMPASFYLSAKPAWFQSLTWPPIGPDVTSGNVGICSGTFNTVGHYSGMPAISGTSCTGTTLTTPAWGGFVNANPAMNCFLNVMGGVPDGTGGALPFDAGSCYAGTPPPAPIASFSPTIIDVGLVPQNMTGNPSQVATLTNTGTANLVATQITMTNSKYTGVNNTCGASSTFSLVSPGAGFTLTPGQSCTFQVTFSPTGVGQFGGGVQVSDNTSSSPDTLTLTGVGTGIPAPANTIFARNEGKVVIETK